MIEKLQSYQPPSIAVTDSSRPTTQKLPTKNSLNDALGDNHHCESYKAYPDKNEVEMHYERGVIIKYAEVGNKITADPPKDSKATLEDSLHNAIVTLIETARAPGETLDLNFNADAKAHIDNNPEFIEQVVQNIKPPKKLEGVTIGGVDIMKLIEANRERMKNEENQRFLTTGKNTPR